MIGYLIKVIICSGVLMLVYTFLLEKEKMYRFNRMYLLFSLVFSLLIPFITINTSASLPSAAINHLQILPVIPSAAREATIQSPGQGVQYHAGLGLSLVLIGYALVVAVLLFRLLRNLVAISNTIKENTVVLSRGVRIVLIREEVLPYSFFNYLFLHADSYNKGQIEKEIICHEMTHIRQKHSIDILLIELLQVFMWFNPVLILFRRAITSNHEFLADSSVIDTFNDVEGYQHLLLEKIISARIPFIASSFNFQITKKRIIMMTKTTSRNVTFFKKIALLPVFGLALFLFSANGIAREDNSPLVLKDTTITPVAGNPNSLQEQYDRILKKHKMLSKRGDYVYNNFSEEELIRLNTLYDEMSKEQQRKQTVFFSPWPTNPVPKKKPTPHQLKLWTHPDLYGVWIDGKRIRNSSLSKYKPDNFGTFVASSLTPIAQKNDGFKVQIDLMTNDYYTNYRKDFFQKLKERKHGILVMKRAPIQ